MYKCIFFTCVFMAFVLICIIFYAATEILKLSDTVPEKEEEQDKEQEHLTFWFWFALAGFIIEVILCGVIFYIRKKVDPCGPVEHYFRIRQNPEFEASRLQRAAAEEMEMQTRAEEMPQASESVGRRSFSAVYDPNRLEAIAERIRRAGDRMDRDLTNHHCDPVPTEEAERY